MDVKGAKALSERLAEAARNVDPESTAFDPGKRWENHRGSPEVPRDRPIWVQRITQTRPRLPWR